MPSSPRGVASRGIHRQHHQPSSHTGIDDAMDEGMSDDASVSQ